jgi:hypothetical protein
MAYSQLENRYLDNLVAVQFPDPPPEAAPAQDASQMPLGTGPDDIQLAMGGGGAGQSRTNKPFTEVMTDVGTGMMNMGAATVKGMGQQFIGTPGDIEAFSYGVKEIFNRNAGEGALNAFLRGMQQKTILPRTEEVKKWLDVNIGVVGDGKSPYESIGEMVGPGGQIVAGKAVVKGAVNTAKFVAPKAADMLATTVEKQGFPIRGLNVVEPGPGAPAVSVKPVQLTRQEKAVISVGAGGKRDIRTEATTLATDLKNNYLFTFNCYL